MIYKLLSALALLLALSPGYAMHYKQYMKLKSGDTQQQWSAKFYVKGAADAYLFGNSHLQSVGRTGVYCQPPKVALSPESYMEILEGEIRRTPDVEQVDYPIAILLMWGLQRAFPCAADAAKYPWSSSR